MVKRKTKYAKGKSKRNDKKNKRKMKTRRHRGGLKQSLSNLVTSVMVQDKKEGLINNEMYNFIKKNNLIQKMLNSYEGRAPDIRASDIAIDVYVTAMIDRIKELAKKDLQDRNIKKPCLDCILDTKLIEKTVENLVNKQFKLPVIQERIQYGRVLHDIPYAKKMFINETPTEILRIAMDECDECD